MQRHKILSILILLALLAIGIPQFVLPHPVAAMSEEFEPIADTYIREDEDTDYHNEEGLTVGVQGPDGTSRTVLRFPVLWGTDVPDGVAITEATLVMDPTSSSADPMTIVVQRLRRDDMNEAYATWINYKASNAWTTAGAASTSYDYSTSGQTSEYYDGSGLDPIEWDVTSIVEYFQQYEDDVSFRVVAYSETAYEQITFGDSEGSYPPVLTITWEVPPDPRYAPTVSTGSYDTVTNETAKLYGDITYVDNGLAIIEGFEWGSPSDPISNSGGNIDWSVSAAGSSHAQIATAHYYEGYQSARLYRDGTNTVRATFDHDAMTEDEAFSVWLYLDNAGSRPAIIHGDGTKRIVLRYNASTDELEYYDGGSYIGLDVYITRLQWTNLLIDDVDWSAGTFDVYQDDDLVQDDIPMYLNGSTANAIRFQNDAGTSLFYIDAMGFCSYVQERGFQYGLTQTPTWTESEEGLFGTGEYDLTVSGLSPGTLYWYRAFVTNDEGTAYGSWASFTTSDTPTISTVAASNVASTSARLNSALFDDGGSACTIKFGWGLTSQTHVEDYDTYEQLPGTYSSGSYPYLDVDGLLAGYTYYFRVSATNIAGTTEGSQLTFNTTSTLSAPTNFVGYPEATEISLSWAKGTGSTNTLVRYGTTAFPATVSTGELAYFGTSNTHTVEDLTSGKTYYFSAWGESGGNYSASYATFMMTTSAAGADTIPDIDVPTQPSRWFSAPDYTTMDGLLVIYDAINGAADSGEIPRETAWFLLALGLSFLAALIAYLALGKKLMIAMIVMTVCFAFGYFVKLIPWWIPLLTLILTITLNQTHKQVAQG